MSIYVPPWHPTTRGLAQQKSDLPARFPWLACVTLIVIASTTPTAGTTTAAWTSTTEATFVGLGAGFIDVQSAAAKFSTVQRSNCLFSFAGVGHLDKSESSRATCIALGNDAYLLDGAVGFKQRPQLCLGGAVRDVAHKKLLHTLPRFARFTSILAYLIKVLRQASGRPPDCPNCGNPHGLKSFIPGPCAGLRWFPACCLDSLDRRRLRALEPGLGFAFCDRVAVCAAG